MTSIVFFPQIKIRPVQVVISIPRCIFPGCQRPRNAGVDPNTGKYYVCCGRTHAVAILNALKPSPPVVTFKMCMYPRCQNLRTSGTDPRTGHSYTCCSRTHAVAVLNALKPQPTAKPVVLSTSPYQSTSSPKSPLTQKAKGNPNFMAALHKDAAATCFMTHKNGQWYILLGKERKNSHHCIMLGSADKGNESFAEIAAREGTEETAGVYATDEKQLSQAPYSIQADMQRNNPTKVYRQTYTFFKVVPYLRAKTMFDASNKHYQAFMAGHTKSGAYSEMTDYMWIAVDDLKKVLSGANINKVGDDGTYKFSTLTASGKPRDISLRAILVKILVTAFNEGTL